MGQRGPKPLPGNVHLLRGNPSKLPLAQLDDGPIRPDVAVPKCPEQLSDEAKAEWRRITKHLLKLGLISHIDRAVLAAYCSAWGEFVWAEKHIQSLNEQDPSGERGRIWNTPSGYKQMSVALQIKNRAMEQLKQFAAEFGMSPAARSRVTPSERQPSLPGMEKPQEGGWANFE